MQTWEKTESTSPSALTCGDTDDEGRDAMAGSTQPHYNSYSLKRGEKEKLRQRERAGLRSYDKVPTLRTMPRFS